MTLTMSGFYFFFFQAEAGIRVLPGTGVQTCALPISAGPRVPAWVARGDGDRRDAGAVAGGDAGRRGRHGTRRGGDGARRAGRGEGERAARERSGERRGGEEGRSRWAADHLKKKKRKEGIEANSNKIGRWINARSESYR